MLDDLQTEIEESAEAVFILITGWTVHRCDYVSIKELANWRVLSFLQVGFPVSVLES